MGEPGFYRAWWDSPKPVRWPLQEILYDANEALTCGLVSKIVPDERSVLGFS